MHLHREVLKQLLSEDELGSLLRREVVEDFAARRQHTAQGTQARDENEIVAILSECGGLSTAEDSDYSLFDRVEGDVRWMLTKLWREKRIMQIPMGRDIYWIATHDFPLFRAALRQVSATGRTDREVLKTLTAVQGATLPELSKLTGLKEAAISSSLAKLERALLVVRVAAQKEGVRWANADHWVPESG